MELEIKKERDTPLLSRKRVTLMMEYKGPTPSRLEFRKMVANQLKAPEELVIIKHIYTRFGQNRAKIIAQIYKDKESMESIEQKYILEKHKPKQVKEKKEAPAEAPAEAPKEGKAEEKPAEEKKEEPKKEEKPAEAKPEEKKEEKPAEAPKEDKKE